MLNLQHFFYIKKPQIWNKLILKEKIKIKLMPKCSENADERCNFSRNFLLEILEGFIGLCRRSKATLSRTTTQTQE